MGKEDKFAGEKGKFEWRDNRDILARSLKCINASVKPSGVVVFTYSSFYDPLTAKDNSFAEDEKNSFCDALQILQ